MRLYVVSPARVALTPGTYKSNFCAAGTPTGLYIKCSSAALNAGYPPGVIPSPIHRRFVSSVNPGSPEASIVFFRSLSFPRRNNILVIVVVVAMLYEIIYTLKMLFQWIY